MANPLKEYRRTQRAIRDLFRAFTESHCAECPEPCCRKPARVDDFDVLLAESLGCRLPHGDPAADRAGAASELLQIGTTRSLPDEPCDFLKPHGCSFPNDLRPLGCTTYVCKFMERDMSTRELQEIKRLGRKLEMLREDVMKAVGLKKAG